MPDLYLPFLALIALLTITPGPDMLLILRNGLRGGSSVLMSWDFAFGEAVDAEGLAAYVAEAVKRNPEYKANRQAVQEKAYAAAEKAGRRPKSPAGPA